MDRKRAAKLLPIIQAFADGEKIQLGGADGWFTLKDPLWNLKPTNYRVKPPKPREFEIMVMGDGYIHDVTKQKRGFEGEVIKVREVLDE